MAGLPVIFSKGLSHAERRITAEWWAALSDIARAQLATHIDPRADSCSFSLQADEDDLSRWREVPVTVDSDLLTDPEESAVDWDADYIEYRLVNPERWRVPNYETRIFFIAGLAMVCASERASTPVLNGGQCPMARM